MGGYLRLCARAPPSHTAVNNIAYISFAVIMVNGSPLSNLSTPANTHLGDLRIRRNQTLIPVLSQSLRSGNHGSRRAAWRTETNNSRVVVKKEVIQFLPGVAPRGF